MDLLNELTSFKDRFDEKLRIFLESEKDIVSKINPTALEIFRELEKIILSNGKRFRPFLANLGFGLVNSKNYFSEDVFQLGIALEIFHSFALVHDDIIDKALTRRGLPTLEVVYQNKFKKSTNSKHLGLSGAILAGDLAYSLSNKAYGDLINNLLKKQLEILQKPKDFINSKNTVDENSRVNLEILISTYSQMQNEVCYGQIDDTLGVGLSSLANLKEEEVINMLDYKSGRYSIEKPFLLGAILGGANINLKKYLSKISINLGIAFQLEDDNLGLFGDQNDTGKPSGIDILEGKRTLLVVKAYQKATPQDRLKMESILGNPQSTVENIEWFKDLVVKTKSLDYTQNIAKKLVEEAKSIIKKNLPENKFQTILYDLGDYLISRSR